MSPRPALPTCALLAAALAACGKSPGTTGADRAQAIELVGSFAFPGDALDLSGLAGSLEDGTPRARLGGFGSAIAWTGQDARYVAADDRGPIDGGTAFPDRLQVFEIRVRPPMLEVNLVATKLLVDTNGDGFVGDARVFDPNVPGRGLRLDPEGLRVARNGRLYLSDEYGPSLLEFDGEGHLLSRLPVPPEYAVAHPAADHEEQITGNTRGRLSNRGFEGLALSPDGSKLYALPQSPLIQDHGRDGRLCRLYELDLASGRTRQLAVALEHEDLSFHELLAIDAQRFLAIERDGARGGKAATKRVIELDLAGASDVSAIAALPARAAESGFACVTRKPFLDLLDPALGLASAQFPEKVEGLAFGPDLADGRHVLIVTSDNDFVARAPTWIWAFAIPPAALPGYVPQVFDARR